MIHLIVGAIAGGFVLGGFAVGMALILEPLVKKKTKH
jgi:hypothetical protein